MEKFENFGGSGIEKIRSVKGVSHEREEEMLASFVERFETQGKDIVEREKTPEEQEILEGIVKEMPDFIREYGGEPIVLRPEYMHIIDPVRFFEKITKEQQDIFKKNGTAGFCIDGDFVGILSQETKLREANFMVHEFLHLQSFMSFTHDKNLKKGILIDESKVSHRQSGVGIFDKQGREYFNRLNEAIIEELTMRFDRQYFQKFKPLEKELKDRADTEQRVDEPKYENAEEIREAITTTRQEQDGLFRTVIRSHEYSYPEERKILRSIISEIYDANKEKYESKEDVFKLFAKAQLSGRLLDLARIIEKSLGKGAFRKLGEETALTKEEFSAEKLD